VTYFLQEGNLPHEICHWEEEGFIPAGVGIPFNDAGASPAGIPCKLRRIISEEKMRF
jgi:hypothetical protein